MSQAVPRVPLLPLDQAKQRAAEIELPAPLAELNIFRVLLRHPVLAQRLSGLLMMLLVQGKLDRRLRELVIMRLGWTTASEYEWAQHWRVARELGIQHEDLLAVRDWRGSDRFSAADRAVLAATDETLETGTISSETWELCRAHVGGTEELLELVAAIGNWRMISSLLRSLEIPIEAGMESWPPDGEKPQGA